MTDWTIHCARCGCVSSTVRRDHDNVARCNACYADEFASPERRYLRSQLKAALA